MVHITHPHEINGSEMLGIADQPNYRMMPTGYKVEWCEVKRSRWSCGAARGPVSACDLIRGFVLSEDTPTDIALLSSSQS